MSLQKHAPKKLYSLQKWFGRAITQPIQNVDEFGLPNLDIQLAKEALLHMTNGPKLSADKRVAIYNQQYWFRLLHTMQDIFPFLLRLFGYEAFNNEIAQPYLLKFPPSHWSLTELGKDLPNWVDKYYNKRDKQLVLEAALIDEAYDRLFYAGHLPKITKMQKDKKLYLQTTIALFSQSSNLLSLRNEFLKEDAEHWQNNCFPSVKWGEKKYFVLYRNNEKIIHNEIDKEQFLLLKAFEKGATLTDAISSTIDTFEAKDIEERMKKWFFDWVKKGFLSFG